MLDASRRAPCRALLLAVMHESKLVIPFAHGSQADADAGHGFHGVLRQVDAPEGAPLPAPGACARRPLAVLTHGLLSHKSAIFFRPLLDTLRMDSFRWDLAGEGETPGTWRAGNYEGGADDLHHVIDYVRRRFGYDIDLLIAHSKGVALTYTYVAKYCAGPGTIHPLPRRMLLCSGRFYMEGHHAKDPKYKETFATQGYHAIQARVRGQVREVRLYPDDHDSQCRFPAAYFLAQVPPSVQVLVTHGLADTVVPPADAAQFVNVLTAQRMRSPGSVRLELFTDADHNYAGDATTALVSKARSWLDATSPPACSAKQFCPRGKLIVVEGLDRAGKSTQVARLVEHLGARYVKFPDRTTAIGQMINAYLTNQSDSNDQAIHLLFSANRWEMLASIVMTLEQGTNVVCDRYAFSGIAYSCAKGLNFAWCVGPDVGLPLPDVTLFLDLDEATAAQRAAYGEERYEKLAFQRLVRSAFGQVERMVLAAGGRWVCIDARGTPDDVWALVCNAVANVPSGPLVPLVLEPRHTRTLSSL